MRKPTNLKPLSRRQKLLADLVAEGLGNKEIAIQMGLSEGVVKVYLSIIFDKLGCQNRTQLALWVLHGANNPEEEDTADIRWLAHYRDRRDEAIEVKGVRRVKPISRRVKPISQGMFSSHFPTHYIPAQDQMAEV